MYVSVGQLVHEIWLKISDTKFFYFRDFVSFFKRYFSVKMVEKKDNPPSAPQTRPIENYWGILKMEVYHMRFMLEIGKAVVKTKEKN